MLLKRYDHAWTYAGAQPAQPRLSLTWHGTAGFTLEAAGATPVVLPFLGKFAL